VASDGEQRGVVGLLTSLCRELVGSPGADGCLASRVIGDVLIGVAEFAPDGRTLQLGGGYLVSDYPETMHVMGTRQPRALSLADDGVDAQEAAILRALGFKGLAMLPLEAGGEVWALIEIYRAADAAFTAEELEVAMTTIARFGGLLDELLTPPPTG
jgi:GAF domain-containing protein